MHVLMILSIVVATGSIAAAITWLEASAGGIARGRDPQTSRQHVVRLSTQVVHRIRPTARELGQGLARLWGMTVRAVSAAAHFTAARARDAAMAVGAGVVRLRAAHLAHVQDRHEREAALETRPGRARFDRSFILTADPIAAAPDTGAQARAFRRDAVDDRHPISGMIGLILVIALVGAFLALALGATAWGVYHLMNARA
jgi:hypothetical protein